MWNLKLKTISGTIISNKCVSCIWVSNLTVININVKNE